MNTAGYSILMLVCCACNFISDSFNRKLSTISSFSSGISFPLSLSLSFGNDLCRSVQGIRLAEICYSLISYLCLYEYVRLDILRLSDDI